MKKTLLIILTLTTIAIATEINLDIIYPTESINVSQNNFFNITTRVECKNATCGEINITLDGGNSGNALSPSSVQGSTILVSDGATVQDSGDQIGWINATDNGDGTTTAYVYWRIDSSGSYSANDGVHLKIFYNNGTVWHTIFSKIYHNSAARVGDGYVDEQRPIDNWYTDNITFTVNYSKNPQYLRGSIIDRASSTDEMTGTYASGSSGTTSSSSRHYDNADTTFNVTTGSGSGSISTNPTSTPFYTTNSNPQTITLNENETTEVTWLLNATGELNSINNIFIYANQTNNQNISNTTSIRQITINDFTLPELNITFPSNITYNTDITELNYTADDTNLDTCWYTTNNGQTNSTDFTSVSTYNGDNHIILYCNDTSSNENSTEISFQKKLPEINIDLITPTTNINATQNQTFQVTATISCSNNDCGEINITLDPESNPASCLELLELGNSEDGTYTIYPFQDNTPISVYCDMSTDGGGWTLFANLAPSHCVEGLTMGSNNLTDLTTTYMTNQFGSVNHTQWLLIHKDNGGLTHTITYNFTSDKNMTSRFVTMVSGGGETVNWHAYNTTGITTGTVTSHKFSDGAGIAHSNWFSRTTLSSDDGTWGVINGATLDGNGGPYLTSVATNRFGFENANSGDSICNTYYAGSTGIYSTNWTAHIFWRENKSYSAIGKTIIPNNPTATPFSTNQTNPYNISLNQGESTSITWDVNSTGTTDNTYTFFIYANQTNNQNIGNQTQKWEVTIVNFTVDKTPPEIIINNPEDNTGHDENITITYTPSEENNITECSLIIDNQVNQTTHKVTKNQRMNFKINKLGLGTHTWSINCTDNSSNTRETNTRKVSIINYNLFTGQTSNLSETNIENISNFTINNPDYGIITFLENTNLSRGLDLNTYTNISFNRIELNSSILSELNQSARLRLYNLTFSNPQILRDNTLCPDNICTQESYTSGMLTFNVTGFSVYEARETPSSSPASSSPGGGGSSGGSGGSSRKECNQDEDCPEGYSCYNYQCIKLFDVEILEINPLIESLSLKLKYFIKGMAGINGDVIINFWIENSNKKIDLGKDTIYLKEFEQKTKTTTLNLPYNMLEGTYDIYVQVTFETYQAESFRKVNIKLPQEKINIPIQQAYQSIEKEKSSFSYFFLAALIIIALISFYFFRKTKKPIYIEKVKDTIPKDKLKKTYYEQANEKLIPEKINKTSNKKFNFQNINFIKNFKDIGEDLYQGEMVGKKVYTMNGRYIGEIKQEFLYQNQLDGWIIEVPEEIANKIGEKFALVRNEYIVSITKTVTVDKRVSDYLNNL